MFFVILFGVILVEGCGIFSFFFCWEGWFVYGLLCVVSYFYLLGFLYNCLGVFDYLFLGYI